MLNLYSVDKKVKEFEDQSKQHHRIEKWQNWKKHNNSNWMQGFRQRLEKFVVDVDENTEEYDDLFTQDKENPFLNLRKYPNAKNVGPARFYFNPFQCDKERIEV